MDQANEKKMEAINALGEGGLMVCLQWTVNASPCTWKKKLKWLYDL